METLHRVQAYNSARGIGNPLHDDEGARALGYPAALVPGVDVYGYLTRAAVQAWEGAWLERGGATCRLTRPVFEGEDCHIVGAFQPDGTLETELRVEGEIRAKATFLPPEDVPHPVLDKPWRPMPEPRPAGSEESLAPGLELGTLAVCLDRPAGDAYLSDQRETHGFYHDNRVVHPAYLLRQCNFALSRNVALEGWIHVGSTVRNFALIPQETPFELRTTVATNYGRNGHRFVELDILVVNGSSGQVYGSVRHVAIYAPRSTQ
ncbi:MAG: hypothetical protein AB7E55_25910 [Pigmentiphaga sp.]